MQRPNGPGSAFSIDSLIGSPQPRSGHLLYTGYPMFMPYRPVVIPQALPHTPLQSGIPPLTPLASFASRLTNTFCASLGQGMPSMVALTTALPSFSDPAESYYPGQELPVSRCPQTNSRRQENSEPEDAGIPEKGSEILHLSDNFPSLTGKDLEPARDPAKGSSQGIQPWIGKIVGEFQKEFMENPAKFSRRIWG